MSSYLNVTPSDTAPLPNPVWRLCVGVGGNIAISGYRDLQTCVLTNVPVGWLLMPMPVVQVWSTNTTASALVSSAY